MMARRRRFSAIAAEDDPLTLVPNLFDVAIVLAVAFLVAALSLAGRTSLRDGRPGRMAAGLRRVADTVQSRSDRRSFQPPSRRTAEGRGTRLGIAYQLENGEIIYVPD